MLMQIKTNNKSIYKLFVIQFNFLIFCICLCTIALFCVSIWIERSYKIPKTQSIAFKHLSLEELMRINEAKKCFQPRNDQIISNLQILEDVMETQWKPGNVIFFHESSCIQSGIIKLNARQACAIESAAKWNPNRTILVTFTSKVGYSNSLMSSMIAILNAYPNIYLRNLDLTRYSAQTPMENWLQTDQLFLSQYLNSHTADFLRYTSMFKFGGIYMDLDVVVQRNFDELPSNFAAAESVRFVAVGAMGFQPNGIGHVIAELCLKEFSSSFNGFKWAHNGPGILTRVLTKICQAKLTPDMTPEKCSRFNVLPQSTFYAIKSKQWKMFFDPNSTQTTLRLTRDSVLIHVWNKYSASEIIRKRREKTAYDVIASINCPKVYQASGNIF